MIVGTLCYVKKDGKTLMIHRNKREGDMHIGKWNGLGGKVENGETPEECVIREVQEEAGLQVKGMKLKGVVTFPGDYGREDWYVFVYVVKEFEGELKGVREIAEGVVEWVADEKLLELNLWEGDKMFIPWLEGEKFFSARFVYDQGKLVEHSVVYY